MLSDREHLVQTPQGSLHRQGGSTTRSTSRPGGGLDDVQSVVGEGGARTPTSDALVQISSVLDTLRSKYRLERRELVTTIGDQIREAKIETLALRQSQMETEHKFDLTMKKVEAMEMAAANATEDADLIATQREVAMLAVDVQKNDSEIAQLKQALLSDRMKAEQTMREADLEEEHLQDRLRLAEKSSDEIAIELQRTREATIDALDAAERLTVAVRPDFATKNDALSLSSAFHAVCRDLEDVRTQNVAMVARLDSLKAYSDADEIKREQQVERLDRVVKNLEEKTAPLVVQQSRQQWDPASTGTVGISRSAAATADGVSWTSPSTVVGSNGLNLEGHRYHSASAAPEVAVSGPSVSTGVLHDTSTASDQHLYSQVHPQLQTLERPSPSPPSAYYDAQLHCSDATAAGVAGTSNFDVQQQATSTVGDSSDGPITTRQLVSEFYLVHNPEKLATLERILDEYEGADDELMVALEAQYGAFGFFDATIRKLMGW